MEKLFEPTSDPTWVLVAEGYDPLREGIYEARFATSNGFLGVRGGRAVSRGSRWTEPHRTYIAGLFDIPDLEHPIAVLVPAPGCWNPASFPVASHSYTILPRYPRIARLSICGEAHCSPNAA